MVLTVGELRRLLQAEGLVAASPTHVVRDSARTDIRRLVAARVSTGEAASADALAAFIDELRRAVEAAAQVPFGTWVNVARASGMGAV